MAPAAPDWSSMAVASPAPANASGSASRTAADPPVTANPTIRLETFSPPGPVGSQSVIFDITQPVAGAIPVVQLSNGAQSDTVSTTPEGLATVALSVVTGQVPPDTAIVEVRANRLRGAVVPGSGQRFIILFQ